MAEGKKFGTAEQVGAAERDLDEWEKTYPEAAEALRNLWTKHLFEIGHKRMARTLLHKEVVPTDL